MPDEKKESATAFFEGSLDLRRRGTALLAAPIQLASTARRNKPKTPVSRLALSQDNLLRLHS
jgi:hypothetical protein